MAQFVPSKKTIKDFNDGEEYLNRIDIPQADTINNLIEGLLYAQENGGGGGGGAVDGTIMLTEGREGGKTLRENDYFLEVVDGASEIKTFSRQNPLYEIPRQETNNLVITALGTEKNQELKIESQFVDENNMLKI